MTTPSIAPYVPNYAQYTPYITAEEFLAAPTGVDVSQLIPSGSTMTQAAALADLIARASSQADTICRKVLAATVDVVAGEYRIFRDQTLRVPIPYKPLVAVTGVSIGYSVKSLAALTDLSGLWPGEKVVRIPVAASPAVQFSTQNPAARARPGWMFAQVTYVNGWAHTVLADDAEASAQALAPTVTAGFVPGLTFQIKDGTSTETATVAADYVYGAPTVPLAAPLQYAHAAGVTVSALPPAIKDAVIDLGKWLVKSRGSKAVVLGSVKGQAVEAKSQKTDPGGDEDYDKAERTLLPFRRAR